MSTKTLRKRIALVAVAALGAGLVSVVPSNAAVTAFSGDTSDLAGTGTFVMEGNGGSVTADSRGVLAYDGSGTTITASMLATGQLTVTATPSSGNGVVTVEGATITSATGSVNSASTLSGLATNANTVAIKPNAGATSFTVKFFNGASAVTASTGGTLVAQAVVSIVAASSAGTFSAANSLVTIGSTAKASPDAADVATAAAVADAGEGFINIDLQDAYNTNLDADLITVTATNGALVGINAHGSVAVGTTSTAYYTTAVDDISVAVKQKTATVPMSTTVTIKYVDTVVGVKTFTFGGEVASIAVGNVSTSVYNSNSADSFYFTVADAAGNALYPQSGVVYSTSSNSNIVGAATVTTWPNSSTKAPGSGNYTCSTYGTAKLKLEYTNASGKTVTSNEFTVACAGAPYSYTAGWDKASYAPGQVATLQITLKDSKGNLANDYEAIGSIDVTHDPVITGAPATLVSATPDYLNKGTAGVLSYKYIVGTTEGKFDAVVSLPGLNSTLKPQAAVTTTYGVASVSTAVSMADVLKAIVSLIASINKQIAALQKALLKK
jgi:hypothetical protein